GAGTLIAFNPGTPRGPRVPMAVGMRRVPGSLPTVENLEHLIDGRGDRPAWFTRPAAEKKGIWLDPGDFKEPGIDTGRLCAYSSPFFAANESFGGVVAVSLAVSDLQHLRDDPPIIRRLRGLQGRSLATQPATGPVQYRSTPLNQGGYIIVDRSGNMISHPDGVQVKDLITLAGGHSPHVADAMRKAQRGEGEIVTVGELDGLIPGFDHSESYVLAIEPIPTTGWLFITAVPHSELMGPIQRVLLNRAWMLGLTLIVPVGIVAVVSRRFCRPIETLADRVHQISRGNLDVEPVAVKTRDEIGRLTSGFNKMTAQLRNHISALTQQSAAREKVESELRIARQIQTDLLPRAFPPFPDRPEFDLHAVNHPARHIAGDFFDFFFVEPDKLLLVIADVSGKGIPAALLMAVTRTIIRNVAGTGLPAARVVEHANRMLVQDSDPGMFVTMFVAEYQPSTGRLSYVNAGHPAAIRFNRNGDAMQCCEANGPIVGVSGDGELGPFLSGELVLQPGDGLLLYTDGLTEARRGDEFYGEQRLLDEVRENASGDCRTLCMKLADVVGAYQRQQLSDDVTVLAIRRTV
ncbi:MAG: SpoIIE family protein phosphatase, partial [Burkholderiales bacterium]|nr:SpoIIE family protein phosphatase [Phycisphaerae bacterium]